MVIAPKPQSGFTLIELSIVLVIIGLLVGGVLVGRDLIRASQLRGLVSEIDQFKAAANTFRLKYGQLPGDMHISTTAQLGFFTFTGPLAGVSQGNNDGKLFIAPSTIIEALCAGEGSVFFYHLSQANLAKLAMTASLDPSTGTYAGTPLTETPATPYSVDKYLPESRAGGFFCSGGLNQSGVFGSVTATRNDPRNVFTLRGKPKPLPSNGTNYSHMEPSISPIDLFSTDKKIDDGKPLQGALLNTTFVEPSALFPYWGAAASSTVCAFGGANATDTTQAYNANSSTGGNSITCQPVFVW